jgi:hypothetical protein
LSKIGTVFVTTGLNSLEVDGVERRVSRSHFLVAGGNDLTLAPSIDNGLRLTGQATELYVDSIRALSTRWEQLAVGLQALLLTTVSTLLIFFVKAFWKHFPTRRGTWLAWRK